MPANDLRLAHFVAVTPARVERLKRDPAALAALREGERDETGLEQYSHAIQYLLAGRAKGVRGPIAWLTGGGERLGRTAGGVVRYLTPERVRALADALAEVEPDDLGDGVYDEAAMDAAGVYPGGWVQGGKTYDPLGTMRELYSYLRAFLAKQRKAGRGVVVVITLAPAPSGEEGDIDSPPPAADDVELNEPSVAGGALVLAGARGRTYERLVDTPQRSLDGTLGGLGYRPLGDLAIRPVLDGVVVRTYQSRDTSVVAAVVLNQGKVASTTFLAQLTKDAVVVVSDAFVQEKAKRRVFATMLSGAPAGQLEITIRERCAALEEKLGRPLPLPADLVSAATLWELWWAKQG